MGSQESNSSIAKFMNSKLCTKLSTLKFDTNIPPFICELSNLIFLELRNNNIPGEFPRNLYNCSKLNYLDISHNLFVGRIPSDIDRMSANLEYLKIGANNFSFEIPASLGRLRNLKELFLIQSQYSGSYPPEFGNLGNLETLDMSRNARAMPSKLLLNFNGLNKLKTLRISDSNLIGEIPEAIGDLGLHDLQILDLSMNRLTGNIPSSIFKLKFLVELDLKNNQLSGMIPAEIGSLVYLNRLDLSQNQLSGAIPGLDLMSDLHFLSLSSNRLTGTIPSRFADFSYWYSFRNNSGLCYDDKELVNELGIIPCDHSRPARKTSLENVILIKCVIVGGVLSIALIILMLILWVYRRKQEIVIDESGSMTTIWKFTPFQILSFTESDILSGLTEGNVVGSGGSGKVYRVPVDQSRTFVAVKRIWVDTRQAHYREKEFLAEVEILGKIRHLNIVKLLCCISSESSKLLVYKYLENRSLDQWLGKKKRGSISKHEWIVLDWPKRLKIAIGAAQGLCYMHHECSPPIVHRDVKSSNILLDVEFNAQIADFGLAKLLMKPGQTNTASVVAGTFGYIAPEYAQTKRLSEKSDVYSFGVVLLELTTGRAGNDRKEEYCLADWAWHYIQDQNPISEALDEEIVESCNLEEMKCMFKLGIMCIRKQPSARPTMKQVLQMLLRCKT